ncbi:transcriptional regulator [Bacillus licheniformis]|uniref:helix-turn-helix domain-containing protein n=1 Tax=Bacillus licheniformis TaxID=1402 RepID=UPI0008FB5B81|nr:helix-turn-helix transcriptional regulator [Bacillus licheniformis]OIS89554.1 transcriptional regulator [Bacillus licheniformis]
MGKGIGKKIRELRDKEKLSQSELANKGMISKWENELGDPSLESARYLALFFNVSLDYLIGHEVKQEPITIAAHHDDEDWTEEELKDIEKFKAYVRSIRNKEK